MMIEMTILLWVAVIILFLVGLIGTVVPGLPGIGFVFFGVLLYAWSTDFVSISVGFVVAAGVAALLAVAADYAGAALGARAGGGGWKAAVMAFSGVIIGTALLGPLGIFVGAFVGGLIGAAFEGATGERAFRSAMAATLGIVGSAGIQLLLAFAVVVGFIVALFV